MLHTVQEGSLVEEHAVLEVDNCTEVDRPVRPGQVAVHEHRKALVAAHVGHSGFVNRLLQQLEHARHLARRALKLAQRQLAKKPDGRDIAG